MTLPMAALRTDMTTSEAKAPAKTVNLGLRDARMAAMRNVLSPISETIWEGITCEEQQEQGELQQLYTRRETGRHARSS